MSTDTKYNGWTNYETWNVHLWLTDDEGSYSYWREQAYDCRKYAKSSDEAKYALVKLLRDSIEEQAQEALNPSGMFSDLLGAALCEVNWYEIAGAFLEECDDE